MNSENKLIQLFEKNIKIENEFNKRLEDFNQQIRIKEQELLKKEQQLDKLRKLFLKEKRQYYATRLFNKGTSEKNREFSQQIEKKEQEILRKEQQLDKLRNLFLNEKRQYYADRMSNQGTLKKNKELNQKLSNVKLKIKNVYQKLDKNNDRINDVIEIIQENKQQGGGQEKQVIEYLDKIEKELNENIRRINYVEGELRNFLSGKDVELEKVNQVLDEILPKKQEPEEENYDQEAEQIIKNIDITQQKITL